MWSMSTKKLIIFGVTGGLFVLRGGLLLVNRQIGVGALVILLGLVIFVGGVLEESRRS